MIEFFGPRIRAVSKAKYNGEAIRRLEPNAMLEQAHQDYKQFIAILDDAINMLEAHRAFLKTLHAPRHILEITQSVVLRYVLS